MANVDIQQLYSGIIRGGRRNAPTYNEVRREVATMARRTVDAETFVRF